MDALPTLIDSSDLAVSTDRLSKQYGSAYALRELALQVPTGSVYLLVGPNGAGKSTTIKILLDLARPTAGHASVLGMRCREEAARIRANVGYVPEQLEWGYGWMRVGRLLEHHARYFHSWDDAYARRLFQAFDIRLEQRMRTLSKGQGRRVHLAMSLAHRPPLLVLDEPTDGLDPVMRDETFRLLVDHISETPTTVLVSTHHVSEFESLADHIGVLAGGELRAQMPLHDLKQGLRRYRADIPVGWNGRSLFGAAAVRRVTSRTQVEWTVWGAEDEISSRLASTGATVRDAASLTLDEATLALLTRSEEIR